MDTQYKNLKYPIKNLKYPIKPKRCVKTLMLPILIWSYGIANNVSFWQKMFVQENNASCRKDMIAL